MTYANIGILAYGLDRPLSGISRTVLELGRALQTLGCAPVFLTPYRQGPFVGAEEYRTFYLPGCRLLPGLMVAGPFVLEWAARRLHLDLIHDPSGISPFLTVPRTAGCRRVVTVHDAIAFHFPEGYTWLNNFLQRSYIPRTLPGVEAVIAPSEHARGDLLVCLPLREEQIHMIPNGVEGRFHPQGPEQVAGVRARYGLPEEFILYVGALEARKNVVGLLRAFALLRQRLPAAHLVVTGRPTWKHEQISRTVADLDLGRSVLFTGFVADDDLPALYSGAKVFCFPSLYEGFGLPVLEAMACGTPVVCSNTTSLPEVAGDAALLVDPTDVDAMSNALERLWSDRSLALDLRRRGLERAKLFTWERTATMTMSVYNQVLGRPDAQVTP